jgi:sec-independent protein translocase protein TatC
VLYICKKMAPAPVLAAPGKHFTLATSTSERKSFFKRIRGESTPENAEMSFIDHLEALRWHIVRAAIAILLAGGTIFVCIDWVFDNIIQAPASKDFVSYGALCRFSHWLGIGDALCMPPVDIKFQFTTVTGPFTTAINISIIGGIIIAFPYLFWELWRFIKPALSPKEVKYARGSIFWVSLCFFAGAAFAYYLLAPFTFNFLANFKLGTKGLNEYKPTLEDFTDTLSNLVLGCAIAFELPVMAYVLAKIGIISANFLRKYFKYAVVVILVVAAIITPSPDWTSQFIVAIPLFALYGISIFLAARVDKKRAKEEKEWS